jgi:hypothetical protein
MTTFSAIGTNAAAVRGSFPLSSYWTPRWDSLDTVTVENANPDKVVLTFTKTETKSLASDFEITGRSITLLERDATNKILTLTIDIPVIIFENDLVVTLNKGAGFTHAVTNNVLDDGHTKGRYRASNLSTISKDGSNKVATWGDELGIGPNFVEPWDASYKPTWSVDGITFTAPNVLWVTMPGYAQPEQLYVVMKPLTWVSGKALIDGKNQNSGLIQQITNDGYLKAYGGAYINGLLPKQYYVHAFPGITTNKLLLTELLFNGASSKFQLNGSSPSVGNCGASNMGGICLANDAGGSAYSSVLYKDIIARDVVDSDDYKTALKRYLKRTYHTLTCMFIGDSTLSFSANGTDWQPVFTFMSHNFLSVDFTYPGANIADLKTYFLTDTSDDVDAVIIQAGLNDIYGTSAALISAYQDLVDTVRTRIGVSKKIILNTMIPCNRSSDQQYIDLNEAIRGNGATPITGHNGIIDTTLTDLNAGDGTLAGTYDFGDHLHENDLGRALIAGLIDAKLTALGL